jgi:predicted metal-binding protein
MLFVGGTYAGVYARKFPAVARKFPAIPRAFGHFAKDKYMAWKNLSREKQLKVLEAKQERRNKRRQFIYEEKLKRGGCSHCRITHPAVLEWHHLDPNIKEKDVSKLAVSFHTKEQLLEEMDKCEVLCANCHRILHWEERQK